MCLTKNIRQKKISSPLKYKIIFFIMNFAIFPIQKLLVAICSLSHIYTVPQLTLHLPSDSVTWRTKDSFDLFHCVLWYCTRRGVAIEYHVTTCLVNHNRPFYLRPKKKPSQVKTFPVLHCCQNFLLPTLTQSFVSKGTRKRETI